MSKYTPVMNNDEKIIAISLDEYKELLMIKGKYEELKSMYYGSTYPKTNITYRNFDDEGSKTPYKVTCSNDK